MAAFSLFPRSRFSSGPMQGPGCLLGRVRVRRDVRRRFGFSVPTAGPPATPAPEGRVVFPQRSPPPRPRAQDGGGREGAGRSAGPGRRAAGRRGPGGAALRSPPGPAVLWALRDGTPAAAMSGAAEARELEERLREAAALGDVREVRRLLGAGADINSRNEIDGW